ncbi:MAG: hypothetical protein DLM63_05600 [Solirubrobacterales bacterium]|nr:MAG: hypothetical protein DLM63_05600 [Solirubrobacterales bacterium]
MRRATFLLTLAVCLGLVTAASAQPVLVLDGHRVVVRDEPLGPLVDLQPGPPAGAVSPRLARVAGERGPRVASPAISATRGTVALRGLRHLRDSRAISGAQFAGYWRSLRAARVTYAQLSGTRRRELGAELGILDSIAARGALTASRLRPLFLTLDRNRQWWTSGSLLSSGERVSFNGSQLIYQYYAGEGLQLQMLGNWGKVNGLWVSKQYGVMLAQLRELIPLGVSRAGGLAWEYYFPFDGGTPPWTSGLSQGTAVQALARASLAFADPNYVTIMHRALLLFNRPAPLGVRQQTIRGNHYLIYSFAPGYHVINAFIGALDGLYDAAYITGDGLARSLLHAGDLEARYELPFYDTGSWARYSNAGETSSDSYMGLLRDFLAGLCARTGTQEYCTYATRFTRYIVSRLGHDLPAQETPYHPPR